jgi:hypothetical protein
MAGRFDLAVSFLGLGPNVGLLHSVVLERPLLVLEQSLCIGQEESRRKATYGLYALLCVWTILLESVLIILALPFRREFSRRSRMTLRSWF